MKTTGEMLTATEVAAKFGVHPETVKNWIHEDKLKAVRLGYRTVRILPKDLEEFVASRYGEKYHLATEVK